MAEIYSEYGTYAHKLLNFEFTGASGAKEMEGLLRALRISPPKEIAGKKVTGYIDYLTQTEYDLPKANVMQFDLEDDAQIIVRPSGTEPQIKIYLTVAQNQTENEKMLRLFEMEMKKMLLGKNT